MLAGQVAVVTGAGSGIGRAAAARLAAEGADVIAVDVNPAALAVAEAVGARFVAADVSRRSGWNDVVSRIRAMGRCDLAFLNAGIHLTEPDVLAVADSALDRVVGVNIFGVVYGLQALAPLMIEGGGGAVVVNASVGGLTAYRFDPVYAMTKHAVIGLTRSSARALGQQGVRLHTLCPGVVDTPLVPEAVRASVEAAGITPLTPDEVAAAVVDLARLPEGGGVWVIQPGVALTRYQPAPLPA